MIETRAKNLAICLAAFFCVAAVQAQPTPSGLWEFDGSDPLAATVGNDLELVGEHAVIQGLTADDGAVTVPTGSYYKMFHGIAANGGGNYLNEYTIVVDFRIPALGSWYAFYNTNEVASNDGEAWIRSDDGAIGQGGYSTFTIQPGVWYRITLTVSLSADHRGYYVDGVKIFEQADTGGVDGRFSGYTVNDGTPWLVLFGDDNGEDGPIDVSTVAVYGSVPSDQEIASFGAALTPLSGASSADHWELYE